MTSYSVALALALLASSASAQQMAKCSDDGSSYSYDPMQRNGVQWDCTTCGEGSEQSPIDIPTDEVETLPIELASTFDYPEAEGDIKVNKGFVVQFDLTDPMGVAASESMSQVVLSEDHIQNVLNVAENFSCDNQYEEVVGQSILALQFHIHTPSEHKIDGKQYPMELHIVNASPDAPGCNLEKSLENCVSVVGIMYTVDDEGEDDEELTRIVNEVTITDEPKDITVDIQALLPDNKSYYTYKGSLTSPPCTQTLLWHVLATPMKVSQKVVDSIQNAVVKVEPTSEYNARLTKELNGRTVFYYDTMKPSKKCPPTTFSNQQAASDEQQAGQQAEEKAVKEMENGTNKLNSFMGVLVAGIAMFRMIQ